jgi:TolB-like protein/Tfp pilus assembly protein PilF
MAKAPADRFAVTENLLAALVAVGVEKPTARPPRVVLTTIVLMGLGGTAWLGWHWRAPADKSIAVVPFTNLSTDSATDPFADGMTEELITTLGQIKGIRIPGRASALQFKDSKLDVRDIGRQLNVAMVVEGTVRRAGNRLRVTAQLMNVSDGFQVWAHEYERELRRAGDVFDIQDSVSRGVATALRLKFGGAAAPRIEGRTDDLEAYDLYLKGRYAWQHRGIGSAARAIPYFEQAIAKDSAFALAYSGLADSYVLLACCANPSRPELYPRAKAAALKAVALDPKLAEGHTSLARVRAEADWDWDGAEAEYRRSIALDPKYATGRTWYSWLLVFVRGKSDEAIREAKVGVQLDPFEPAMAIGLGIAYYYAEGHDSEAVEQFRRAVALQPTPTSLFLRYLGEGELHQGHFDQAVAALSQSLRVSRDSAIPLAFLAAAQARKGNEDSARAILTTLHRARPVNSLAESIVYAHLGEIDAALGSFEAAVRAGPGVMTSAYFRSPIFEPLRSSPRYVAALRKAGVEP